MVQLEQIKIYLLDMDGTFYLGNRIFDWSYSFLDKLAEQNKDFYFLTNNSSNSRERYVAVSYTHLCCGKGKSPFKGKPRKEPAGAGGCPAHFQPVFQQAFSEGDRGELQRLLHTPAN